MLCKFILTFNTVDHILNYYVTIQMKDNENTFQNCLLLLFFYYFIFSKVVVWHMEEMENSVVTHLILP